MRKDPPKKVRHLTDEDRVYIRENHRELTIKEMAALRKLPYCAVYQYCRSQALTVTLERKKVPRAKVAPRPVKRIFNSEYTPEKSDMVRPPAKYGNRSQQDVIDYYLNLEI